MVWHSALISRRCTPIILHNEWSSSRNLQREFVGVMNFMATTVVSTTKMDVGWEKEAAKLKPSRDLSAPDPAITRISEFACEKRQTTRDVRSMKISLPYEDTSSPWTVWQNRVPFLTITWLSEVEGLNFVMPPLLLESATYTMFPSKANPIGCAPSGSFISKFTVPFRKAPLLLMHTW